MADIPHLSTLIHGNPHLRHTTDFHSETTPPHPSQWGVGCGVERRNRGGAIPTLHTTLHTFEGEIMIDTRKSGYPIFFTKTPKVGTKIAYWGGHTATLIGVSTYRKKSGDLVPLLEWAFSDGRIGTSGLRGKTVYWRSIAEVRKEVGR